MKLLDRLDRIVRPIAVPNLTQILIAGQAALFIATIGNTNVLLQAPLVWDNVLQGEVWRLITFLFVPVSLSPIWLFFALYIFYIFGVSLQNFWGYVRYNTFLWLGTVLTVAAAGIAHDQPVTGGFLGGTVFLAFATYNPNFELRLFFILPVKVKWLAYFQAAGYILGFAFGTMPTKMMVLASIGNYLIFFSPIVFQRIKNAKRRIDWEARQHQQGNEPRHTCVVCGANSNTHPKMDFRYCSKCDGERAYCEEHLKTHEHVVEGAANQAQ